MPIPLLLIGIGAGTAALGLGKSIKAGFDQHKAKITNKSAKEIIEESKSMAEHSRKLSGDAISQLGSKKIYVLHNTIIPFIKSFEKLHNVDLTNSEGLSELSKLKIDQQFFDELKEMGAIASTLIGGAAGGAAAGAITAFGAYSAAMTLGTCATTGTAIASLSGVAATNATLAFLGGGALSVGGLGMAGGTAVLGGLVAGPALAIFGFVIGAKANANKQKAYANLASAKEFAEECKTIKSVCNGIRLRANMYERLLIKLDNILFPLVYALENIIDESGKDYSSYTPEQKRIVAASLSAAVAVKAVLDTPILTEEGTLTPESERISESVIKVIEEHPVER